MRRDAWCGRHCNSPVTKNHRLTKDWGSARAAAAVRTPVPPAGVQLLLLLFSFCIICRNSL